MTTLREPLHVDAVAGLDPDTPVVMLNLMKFTRAVENGTERHLILALHAGYSKLATPTT